MIKKSPAQIRRLTEMQAPPAPPSQAHHVHHYLHLASALGASSAPCPPRLTMSAQELDQFAREFKLPKGALFLGLCPGAEYGPAKCWPVDRFAMAAEAIARRTGCHWLVFGTDGTAARVLTAFPGLDQRVHDLTGRTSLRQLLAGLRLCRLVLTNDSGPMHAAAALGTPVVVPFGSTSPELTGPGLPGSPGHIILRQQVPCAPCFLRECPIDHRCMTGISVDDVIAAVMKQLAQPNPIAPGGEPRPQVL
jgi:heptosyltransferase-2